MMRTVQCQVRRLELDVRLHGIRKQYIGMRRNS